MTRKKNPFRPATRAMALEPRILFDGAAAVAVADHPAFSPERDHPAQDAAADHGAASPAAMAEATLAHPAAEAPAPSTIVIIDARVADYQSLLPGLPANALVRVVQTDESGLAAISQALQGRTDIGSVQIVSHGTPGQFTLGSDHIDGSSLATQAAQDAQLQSWAQHLSANADILLYGCDIAQGAQGLALLTQLASLTGADIAASTDPTGAARQGGDWTLEAATGPIEAKTLTFASYDHLLAATAVNDANAATPRTTAEDTPLAISGLTIADADNPASMTLHVQTAGGTASVTALGSATISAGANGSADFTLSGSMAEINTALASLQYTPDANKNSSTTGFTPKIDLTATDVSNGGSGTLSVTNIAVTAVNDAPDLSTGVPLTVSEGGNSAFALAQLASSANALDVDIATGQQVLAQQMVTITTLPALGTLSYNGGVVEVGSVIPVTGLGSLVYTHNGTDIASNAADTFTVTVSDGGGATTPGTLSITITPKNVAPTVSGSPTLIEGQVKVVAPTIALGDSYDTLANANIVIDNIVTGSQGTLFIDANGNNVIDAGEALSGSVTLDASQRANLATQLKFFQNGAEPNAPGAIAPSYQIHVTDAGGGEGAAAKATADQTITLTVLPNNDDPTLTNAHATPGTALSVAERTGQSPVTLTTAMLQIQDADRNPADTSQTTPANQLVYTIGTRPAQGEIQLYVGGGAGYGADGWITLGDGGRFTQADVDAGHVRYYQTTNVTAATPDNFTFTVRDSAFGYDVWTDPANPTGGREGGLRNTPTGPIATQTFYIDVTADATTNHDAYEGDPRPATSGYGGSNLVYHFVPTGGMTNGNGAATWNEANVSAGGGYVIGSGMLSYTITRTDTKGTPDPTDDVSVTIPPTETVYTLTSQPPNGTVQRNIGGTWTAIPTNGQFTQADIDAGNIRFVHDGSENHTASFGYTVSDGTPNHYGDSFALNITPTNDRPTASGGAAQVTEGSAHAVRLDGSVIGMNDVDLSQDPAKQIGEGAKDFLWFQITDVAKDGGSTPHGSLQRWNGSAWVDVSTSEWLPSTLLTASADGGTSGLRYVHDGSEPLAYSGGPKLHFSYVVRDDLADPGNAFATNSTTPTLTDGSPQSNQSAPAKATIQIIPVNNPPQVADKPGDPDPSIGATIPGGGALTGANEILANVPEGGTATITSAHLTAIDPDNTTVQRQYRITQAPTQGVLQLNGAALGVGSTFTQADIDTGKVTYKHKGTEIGAPTTDALGTYNDKFLFVVNDGVAEDTGNAFLITLTPTNDKPTLTAPSGPINIDSATAANNPIKDGSNHVFTIADPDLTDGVIPGETDFVQATVRILDAVGNPITNYASGFASGGVSIDYATPGDTSGLWKASGGSNSILQVQGTRAQVNAALAGLSVTFANDTNTLYRLQVIVDDRMRDASGALTGGANGGTLNQAATPGGDPTAVPNTVYDWTSAASPAANDPNLSAATVDLRASSVNQTPTFTGPGSLTVNEDTRTQIIGGFTVADPESAAFGTPVSVTVSVGSGTLDFGATGAQTSITPSGGQAVTISGDNSANVTLTGRAADIQALLNGRNFADTADDTNGGLFYTGALNVNHDTNGAAAGDVTLTLSFDDAGSRIGGDVGAGSVAANPANIVNDITLTAINDAPTVGNTATAVTIADTSAVAVSGFSIGDVDSNDGYATGETDGIIQATVRVLNSSNTPLTATEYANLGIVLSSGASVPGVTVDATLGGNNAALEVRGTLADLNSYLAGLQVQFSNLSAANVDGTYSIEVVADDRLRDAPTGTLTGGANGGVNNQQPGLPSVPSTDTFDAYATQVVAYGVYDVVGNTRPLFISSINDPGNITANAVTVNEGSATLVLDASNANISVTDPDSNGSATMSTTVTVDKGVISAVGGSGGSVSGTGTNTITITGVTQAELNTRLQALTITFPDEAGAPTSADWNGSFTVTVVYNDNGNTGTRPASLAGDTNDPTANPGDYSYADGSSNILVTTRTFTVTVNGVNDAPTRTDATPVTLPAATEDTDGGSGDTVNNLFVGKFSDALDSIPGGSNANSFAGIAITTNNAIAAQGKWQYSTDGGTNWTDLPAVSASSALLLDTNAKLRFDPAADFHGTPGGLDARLIDSSGGGVTSGSTADVAGANAGGTTRYSDASNAVTLNTSVTNVNDRPTGADATLAAIPEDSTNPSGATIASLGFGYADATDNQTTISGGADASTPFGGIAIVGNTADASTQGVWQYSTDGGGTWSAVGSPSDVNALILSTTASLRFVPVANYNGTPDGLTVRLADSAQTFSANSDISATVGNQTSTWSTTHTLGTTVTPTNDAPAISGTATNPTFTEGGSAVALLTGGGASDIDLPGSVTFGSGSITVKLDSYQAGDTLSLSGTPTGVASTSGGNGADLVIHLNTAATPATVGSILDAIQFGNTSDDPTAHKTGTDHPTRTYSVVLNDGNNTNGAANAGGPSSLDSNVLSGTITVTPVNDPPVGVNDSNSVTEDATPGTASGNVITDGTPDHDPDNTTAELSVSGIRTGAESGSGSAGTLGTALAGQYGNLTLNADGSYSYALDNANPAVNALLTGQTLTEAFTYTVQDPGGLTDTAQLTITIHGHTDGGPQITAVDGNAGATGEATVLEHGLTSASDHSETTAGAITISAADGLDKVTINGTDITLSALTALGTTPVTIPTAAGTLTLTGYTSTSEVGGVSTAGTLSYTYTLTAPIHNAPGATESTDVFNLGVTDRSATSATGTLTVQIVDDVPTAAADTHTVTEGATLTVPAADGVLKNDSAGADGWAAGGGVVGVVAGNGGTPTTGVGTAIVGSYGTLTLAADGSYSYSTTADSISADATDVFTYTVRDGDGDATTATLTIEVKNVTVPGTPASNTVNESGLAGGSTPGVGNTISNASLGLPAGETAVAATGTASHGTYTVNADGTYSYTLSSPTSGDATTDSFSYTAKDNHGNTVTNTVTIAIVDDVPTAKPDTHDVTEDTALNTSGNVLTGTTGGDQADTQGADGATVTGVKAGAETGPVSGGLGSGLAGGYGTLTLAADGSYGYTLDNANPAVQALGVGKTLTDTFTYTITDGDGDTSTTTLTITIHGTNDAPQTVGSLPARTGQDSDAGIAIPTASGFTDIDGDTLTYGATGLPPGLAIAPATGLITGKLDHSASQGGPAHDGVYTVSVTADDGHGGTVTQTFTYTVTNPAPTANNDTRTTAEDTPVSGNVISGSGGDVADSDPDGDPLQVTQIVVGGQTHTVAPGTPATVNLPEGTLVFSSDGSYTFTPTKDWNGTVPAINYTVSDGEGGTASATLAITVTPVVDIADDSATTTSGVPVKTPVLANDSFENPDRTVTGVTQGAHGTVAINPDGTLTYTPAPGYVGSDSYTYTVTSGGVTETATVTVSVVNTPPVASPDTAVTPEDTPVSGSVLANDSDPEGDPLAVTGFDVGGQHYTPGQTANIPGVGTLTLGSDGHYSFTPVPDWNGAVPAINYTVSDGKGGTASATLAITVTPVVDIADDSATTTSGVPVKTPVLANDSFENPDRTVTGVTQGAHGTVAINPDGTLTYTPAPGYVGSDSYTYTVTSGGVTETATVTVNVMAENPPLAVPPFGATPPALPIDSLQPRDPLVVSPVVNDPGVYFAGERSDTVLRLPIPLHPITYVEGAVEQAQQARWATDPLLFSNPAAVRLGEVQSASIGAGLGFDPVVYVTPAVRGSQALGQLFDNVVNGRLERLSLSSDREIPTPDLTQPDPRQLVVMPREADKPHTTPPDKPTHAKGHKKSADAGNSVPELPPQALRAAPAFSDQLRASLKRPVAALYARFNSH